MPLLWDNFSLSLSEGSGWMNNKRRGTWAWDLMVFCRGIITSDYFWQPIIPVCACLYILKEGLGILGGYIFSLSLILLMDVMKFCKGIQLPFPLPDVLGLLKILKENILKENKLDSIDEKLFLC